MCNSEPSPFHTSCPSQLHTWGQTSLHIYHKLSNTLIQRQHTLLKILLAFLLIRNLWAATTNASVVDVRQNLILHQTLKGVSQDVKRNNSDARMFPFKYRLHNYKWNIVFQLPVFATFTGEVFVRLGEPDDGRPRSLFSRSFSVFSIFFGVVSCVCFCGRAETNTPIK